MLSVSAYVVGRQSVSEAGQTADIHVTEGLWRVLRRTFVVAATVAVLLALSVAIRAFGDPPLLDPVSVMICASLVAATFVAALASELIPLALRFRRFLLGCIFTSTFFAGALAGYWGRGGVAPSPSAFSIFVCFGLIIASGMAYQVGASTEKATQSSKTSWSAREG